MDRYEIDAASDKYKTAVTPQSAQAKKESRVIVQAQFISCSIIDKETGKIIAEWK